ncbi:MAG TPA: glycoside hydrolase family 27 protein [Opitutaceae bacterium]|nr:glycoside hydrolase family 27 protein [Opitutaceae bacterium]
MKRSLLLLAALLALAAPLAAQKFKGLAPTPPMGWNTWNTFHGEIDEWLIRETADAMIANGMRDAGYRYIVVDDCWAERARDAAGNLVPDKTRFPSGMKALGDYLHERGFKFGIYSCAGDKTCAGFPGSRGHEFQDARTFASWGVDYLKYDWCNTGTRNAREAYETMRDALHAAGRPVVFSICEWGTAKPWEWARDVGHLWRTTGDIMDCYDCRQQWSMGWKVILDLQATLVPSQGLNDGLEKFAGPDGWNDPDMMEVGNPGLPYAESRAHFSLWCMLAAPLIAGNDVRKMSPEIRDLLVDREALAINQDPLGRQGWRFRVEAGREIWVKALADGDWAVCLFNTGTAPAELGIDWAQMGQFLRGSYSIRDVWAKQLAGDTTRPYAARIDARDVKLLRLTPRPGAAKPSP